MKISENYDSIWEKNELFSISNVENAKIFDESLLKYCDLSGAKACKSCRSRQELSNGGELRDAQEEFSESVRYCYGHLSKFSFSVSLHVPFLNLLFE